METKNVLRTFLLTGLISGGCDGVSTSTDTTSFAQSASGYPTRPNGTGIHVGSTYPESQFGLTTLSTNWFLTGFSPRPDGSLWATGWYSLGAVPLAADAQVQSATYEGGRFQVQAIHTAGSSLSIELRDNANNLRTLRHAQLVGLVLWLDVPDPTGLTSSSYALRIASAENLESQAEQLYGYRIDYNVGGLLRGSWSSFCKGPHGESQRSVFYQGAQWNPLNGARTDGANLLTMTCETGAVATCMKWGYTPWDNAQAGSGMTDPRLDLHQACLHMKRASYCGDSHANTVDGTPIIVSDGFNPPINSGPLDFLEALWTPTGAACVSNRRHPEIPFIGCPLPLPPCPKSPRGDYLLASGLPAPESLLGLSN